MSVESIRESVSNAYAKAISKATPSCCGPKRSCCESESSDKETVANLAGYGDTEIGANPEVAASSFGCGNPLAFSEVQKGEIVLDLGSGAGFDLLIANEKVGPGGHVIGIDMTDEMIVRAEKNIKYAGVTNIEVRKGIIEKIPVEDSSVDWVISNCVINLSPEKDKVFKEIHRVLKPGGRMLVSDIVVSELPQEIRDLESLYYSCVAGAISEEDYILGLAQAGLTDIKVLERIVYEANQIRAIFDNEETGMLELLDGRSKKESEKAIHDLINKAAGKVWSAKFSARKPM